MGQYRRCDLVERDQLRGVLLEVETAVITGVSLVQLSSWHTHNSMIPGTLVASRVSTACAVGVAPTLNIYGF